MSASMSTRFLPVEAARGNIFANDMSLLATSVPQYDLHMDMLAAGINDDKVFNEKVDSLAAKLAQLFGDKPANEYAMALREARRDSARYQLIRHGGIVPGTETDQEIPDF